MTPDNQIQTYTSKITTIKQQHKIMQSYLKEYSDENNAECVRHYAENKLYMATVDLYVEILDAIEFLGSNMLDNIGVSDVMFELVGLRVDVCKVLKLLEDG